MSQQQAPIPASVPLRSPARRSPGGRILLNAAIDGGLAAVAAPAARFVADPHGGLLHPFWFLAGGAITLLLAGLPFRLPQQYWRFAGFSDLLAVAGGSVMSAALFAFLVRASGFPLPSPTFPVVHALVLFVLMGGARVAYRLYQTRSADGGAGRRVLLVGADEGADLFLRAAAGHGEYRVAGILSLSDRQRGRRLRGHPILGGLEQAGAVLAALRARGRLPAMLVVTEPDLAGSRLEALLDAAGREGVPVRRAPRPTALSAAPIDASPGPPELRPIAIEDLLDRPQAPLDRDGMARLVRGRRVMVTGAGGTIGGELARQAAALAPSELLLLDNGEYALWRIDLELSETHPALPRRAILADIRDAARIEAVFAQTKPELVFHAAALKHVPMVEANKLEGLLTNACGTRHVADAARAAGARAMVLVSTDKAVNPSSLMGASKRLAEMYCQALDIAATRDGGLRCVTVRFGNVLGSTGSVVPLFRRQLARGGPLTVTHPEMRRYFMTVREAVGLVLQACVAALSGAAGGRGGVFVLDMGAPVRIADLARRMIQLAGLRPDLDIKIRFTGPRPGEKLFEELFHGQEPPRATALPGLLTASPRAADPDLAARAMDEIAAACRAGREAAALAALARMVPEFTGSAMHPDASSIREDAWVDR